MFLAIFDVAVGVAGSRLRADLRGTDTLTSGVSSERKLRAALVGEPDGAPLLLDHGWIGAWEDQPVEPRTQGGVLVASYGMSFSHRASRQLAELEPRVTLRLVGGPGAPLNHAYACYEADRGRHEAHVVVLGILGSNLPLLRSMSQITCTEVPAVYTYPRYHLADGELHAVTPVAASLGEMRRIARDPQLWDSFVAQTQAEDPYYTGFGFHASPLDHLTLGRVLQRAWRMHHTRQVNAQAYRANGFDPGSETVQVARALVSAFARSARADGRVPVVLLFDNTSPDHLFRALAPVLDEHAIPHVSSHALAPSTDPRNFLPDRHLAPEAERRVAVALRARLEECGVFGTGNDATR